MKRIVMGLCITLAMAGQSFGGCIEGNCVNGHGTYEWSDGTRYTGTIHNKAPDGQGSMLYPDGGEYTGALAGRTLRKPLN